MQRYYPMRDPNNPDNITLIPVSEEVYRIVYRDIWKTQKRMQRSGQCLCTRSNLWKCDGDCLICRYYKRRDISLSVESDGDFSLEERLSANDDTGLDKDVLITLYDELEALDEESQKICRLLMDHSERESAEILGMPFTTFRRRWASIKETLRKNLEDLY